MYETRTVYITLFTLIGNPSGTGMIVTVNDLSNE